MKQQSLYRRLIARLARRKAPVDPERAARAARRKQTHDVLSRKEEL